MSRNSESSATLRRRALGGALPAAALAALGALFTAPAEAAAQPQSRFLFSPVGPGAGHGTIGMGGRTLIIIPMYDLNYVRGLTDNLDFTLGLDTLGVISFTDIGLRARLLGDPDSGFSLGVKAAATPVLFFIAGGSSSSGGFFFALTPGAVMAFGSRSTQFSLALDVPVFLGGAAFATNDGTSATGSTSDTAVTLRPTATIEFPVGESTNMYVQAQGYVLMTNGSGVLAPILAVGAAW